MSREIRKAVSRSEGENQQNDRNGGKVLITAVPPLQGSRREQAKAEEAAAGSKEQLMSVLIRQDRLTAVQTFTPGQESRIGTVYLGKVKKIVQNLDACFVEITDREQCFLPLGKMTDSPFLTNRPYDGRILEGDELLVQIEHDAIKSKQAALTTRISIQGEYFVFSMGNSRTGISKKLNEKQRSEVKRFLMDRKIVTDASGTLVQQEGVPAFGLVVRTQAGQLLGQDGAQNADAKQEVKADILSGASGEETAENILYREYERLRREFTDLFLQGKYRTCFGCLRKAGSALEEALRPFRADEYGEVVTDRKEVYEELIRLQSRKPSLAEKKLRFYQDDSFSLSQLYSLQTKLEEALGKTVWMKSGANLVIEQTESLTAIDVNTGKCIAQPGGKSSEETIRRVNLEAAQEVSRQLRLRNLSGIIIVDFINLSSSDQDEELLQSLRELVKKDTVTVQVVDMTPLGLVEITRKKGNPSLSEQFGRHRNGGKN